MPGVEIERRWLVPEAPPFALGSPPPDRIQQGYLTIASGGAETRVRRRGASCFLTVKSGSGMTRAEHEIGLSAEQFEALWPATAGARLEKQRYTLRADGGHVIELDVYEGALRGLLIAEVEFGDLASAMGFVAPHWFGREVTDEPGYRNQRLAVDGVPPAPMSR